MFSVKSSLLLLAIVSTANSAVLRCSFYYQGWPVVGSRYTCLVIGIEHPEIPEIVGVFGDHLIGHGDGNVEALITDINSKFDMFPKDIEKFFPRLLAITINEGNLSQITSDDLASWPNLVEFTLAFTAVRSLDGNLFQQNQKLAYISIQGNPIESVGADLLSGLTELRTVYFRSNLCLNYQSTRPSTLESLKNQLLISCPPAVPTTEAPTMAPTTVKVRRTTTVAASTEAPEIVTKDPYFEATTLTYDQCIDSQAKRIQQLKDAIQELETNLCSCQSQSIR